MVPWHIDTDGGVDDALALVMLAHAEVPIAAVSSVFGNTWVDQAASNANLVLRQSLCVTEVLVGAAQRLAQHHVGVAGRLVDPGIAEHRAHRRDPGAAMRQHHQRQGVVHAAVRIDVQQLVQAVARGG